MMPDGTLDLLSWMAAFLGPFIPRIDNVKAFDTRAG